MIQPSGYSFDPVKESLEPVQREGSPEDDGSLSASATLARDAVGLFQSGHYHECIGVLKKLLQKEDDPKVGLTCLEYFSLLCQGREDLVLWRVCFCLLTFQLRLGISYAIT